MRKYKSYIIKIVSLTTLVAFIVTQCGISYAFNQQPSNLRKEATAEAKGADAEIAGALSAAAARAAGDLSPEAEPKSYTKAAKGEANANGDVIQINPAAILLKDLILAAGLRYVIKVSLNGEGNGVLSKGNAKIFMNGLRECRRDLDRKGITCRDHLVVQSSDGKHFINLTIAELGTLVEDYNVVEIHVDGRNIMFIAPDNGSFYRACCSLFLPSKVAEWNRKMARPVKSYPAVLRPAPAAGALAAGDLSPEAKPKSYTKAAKGEAKANGYAKQNRYKQPKDYSGKVIVIGGSLGGYSAIAKIIEKLPADHPPVIISEHLGLLSVIDKSFYALSKDQSNNIIMTDAENDFYYLDKGMVLVGISGVVIDRDINGYPLARVCFCNIDDLFESAARHFGKDVICVVVSGSGDDGKKGAKIVDDAKGVVLVQFETDKDPRYVLEMPRNVMNAGFLCQGFSAEVLADVIMNKVNSDAGLERGSASVEGAVDAICDEIAAATMLDKAKEEQLKKVVIVIDDNGLVAELNKKGIEAIRADSEAHAQQLKKKYDSYFVIIIYPANKTIQLKGLPSVAIRGEVAKSLQKLLDYNV